MKKQMMIAFTILAVVFQVNAAGVKECVPTQTVQEAKAEYDAGIAQINNTINQAYANAVAAYDQSNATALVVYNAETEKETARYNEEVKEIRASMRDNWHQELVDATVKHNQTISTLANQYNTKTQFNLTKYNDDVNLAQAIYSKDAAVLAAKYNAAVCAAK